MKQGVQYPDYIGISDVSSKSYEQMRVEAFFEGVCSDGLVSGGW